MKVLAGVDGSQKSVDAMRFATRLLDPVKDTVVLYYRPPEVHISGEEELVPSIPTDIRQRLVRDVFDKAREMLPAEFHERVETIEGERKPAEGLLLAAEQHGADLIVVGADAKHRGFGPFLGGVARKVAREAPVPVLVYRGEFGPREGSPLYVLLAHDGSAAATQAGQQLDNFHWPSGSTGTLVRVMEWIDIRISGETGAPSIWQMEYERYVEEARAHAEREAMALRDQMPVLFHNEPPVVAEGAPVDQICELAKTKSCDLIVVGPHNRGLTRRVFGATTESLLHYAPCSVLVCHQSDVPST